MGSTAASAFLLRSAASCSFRRRLLLRKIFSLKRWLKPAWLPRVPPRAWLPLRSRPLRLLRLLRLQLCREALRSRSSSHVGSIPAGGETAPRLLSRLRTMYPSVLFSEGEPGGESASREGEAMSEPPSFGLRLGGERLSGVASELQLPIGRLDTGLASAAWRRHFIRLWSVPLCSSSNSFFRRHSCWIKLAACATFRWCCPRRAFTQPGCVTGRLGLVVVAASRSAASSLSILLCPAVPLTETSR